MILRRDENSSSVEKLSVVGEVSPVKASPKTFASKNILPSPLPDARTTPPKVEKEQEKHLVEEEDHSLETDDVASPKPFFIMDWLEQIDPADLELAQLMLKTPQKPNTDVTHLPRLVASASSSSTAVEGSSATDIIQDEETKVQPRDLFQASSSSSATNCTSDAPSNTPASRSTKTSTKTPTKSSSETISFYRRRSIAVGNGWNAKGLSKARQGLWQDALACWENALAVRTQVLGEQHIDVANTANNMGIAYGKLQQAQQAMAMLQMALEIRQVHYGEKHAEVAATLHNIGNVLQQCGQLETAIEYFGRAMELQRDLLGTDRHALVARAGMAMGHAYYQGHMYPHALAAYCDALAIFEWLQHQQGHESSNGSAGKEDYSAEIEATRADVQELQELIHQQASSSY